MSQHGGITPRLMGVRIETIETSQRSLIMNKLTLEVFHSSEYDLMDYFEEPAPGWYYWKVGPGIHVLDLDPKGPFPTREEAARAAGCPGRAGSDPAVSLPQGWEVRRANRTYDEQFVGTIYWIQPAPGLNGGSQIPGSREPALLVAELRTNEGLYLSKEFEVDEWNEAARYLDQIYEATILTPGPAKGEEE